MSNRSFCGPKKFLENYRSSNSTNEHERCKLPAIYNGITTMPNMNSSSCNPSLTPTYLSQPKGNHSTRYSHLKKTGCNTRNTNNLSTQVNCAMSRPSISNICTSSYDNCQMNCPPRHDTKPERFSSSSPSISTMCNDKQTTSTSRVRSSNQYIGFDKAKTTTIDVNKTPILQENNNCSQQLKTLERGNYNCFTKNMNTPSEHKTVIRDRHLASEILQKAGISSILTQNDCLEVIADTPITANDNVNCDPNPLCMKKSADCQVILKD